MSGFYCHLGLLLLKRGRTWSIRSLGCCRNSPKCSGVESLTHKIPHRFWSLFSVLLKVHRKCLWRTWFWDAMSASYKALSAPVCVPQHTVCAVVLKKHKQWGFSANCPHLLFTFYKRREVHTTNLILPDEIHRVYKYIKNETCMFAKDLFYKAA